MRSGGQSGQRRRQQRKLEAVWMQSGEAVNPLGERMAAATAAEAQSGIDPKRCGVLKPQICVKQKAAAAATAATARRVLPLHSVWFGGSWLQDSFTVVCRADGSGNGGSLKHVLRCSVTAASFCNVLHAFAGRKVPKMCA